MKDETRSKKQLIEELASFRRRISRLESEKARLSVLVNRNAPESIEMAQRYLDIVHEMIVELDRSGKVVQINKRGCEILGYKEKEIIGKNWFDNYLPEYFGPEVKSVFKELMSGKLKAQEFFENPILTKGGEERLIAWHNIILKEPEGKITGAISSGLDITDEFYTSEALKESEERFSKIAMYTPAIIFIINNEGKFVLSEGKGLSVLGLKPGEAVGKSAYEMYKDFPAIVKGIKSALRGKTYEDVIDVNGIKFDIFYTPYRNSAGDIIGLIGMAIDITARKEA